MRHATIGTLITAFAIAPAEADDDPRVDSLREHAVVFRSIEPGDDDFTDLEPLKGTLGEARVVQLGEQSHGDGATFHAKTRLIRFLHQEMGFDVAASTASSRGRRPGQHCCRISRHFSKASRTNRSTARTGTR